MVPFSSTKDGAGAKEDGAPAHAAQAPGEGAFPGLWHLWATPAGDLQP